MCHRMSPLLMRELMEAERYRKATGRAIVPHRVAATSVPDAFPGTQVPLFVPDDVGELVPMALTWGFPQEKAGKGHARLVFNTRIETARAQARAGEGLWAEAALAGRCLVPVRAFWESWTTPGAPAGSRGARRQVRFRLAGHGIFLIACVREADRFSVVTTMPNAAVAPYHGRMPLVLAPGESEAWLGPDWADLADRSGVRLEAMEEA